MTVAVAVRVALAETAAMRLVVVAPAAPSGDATSKLFDLACLLD